MSIATALKTTASQVNAVYDKITNNENDENHVFIPIVPDYYDPKKICYAKKTECEIITHNSFIFVNNNKYPIYKFNDMHFLNLIEKDQFDHFEEIDNVNNTTQHKLNENTMKNMLGFYCSKTNSSDCTLAKFTFGCDFIVKKDNNIEHCESKKILLSGDVKLYSDKKIYDLIIKNKMLVMSLNMDFQKQITSVLNKNEIFITNTSLINDLIKQMTKDNCNPSNRMTNCNVIRIIKKIKKIGLYEHFILLKKLYLYHGVNYCTTSDIYRNNSDLYEFVINKEFMNDVLY